VEKSKYPLYKGGYGRGEGVYHYHHPCHTTFLPKVSPMGINKLLTRVCG